VVKAFVVQNKVNVSILKWARSLNRELSNKVFVKLEDGKIRFCLFQELAASPDVQLVAPQLRVAELPKNLGKQACVRSCLAVHKYCVTIFESVFWQVEKGGDP